MRCEFPPVALGSANFGSVYGINNTLVDATDIRMIFSELDNWNGVVLDTADGYGSSAAIIKRNMRPDWQIIMKVNSRRLTGNFSPNWDLQNESLDFVDLFAPLSIDCLMVHDSNFLKYRDQALAVMGRLNAVREGNNIKKIGISVYDPYEVELLLELDFKVDIVQIPMSVCDKRFFDEGLLIELSRRRVEIHARSLFLQGLLLKDKVLLPSWGNEFLSVVESLDNLALELGVSRLDLLVGSVLSHPEITRIVVGVDHHIQLKELLDSASHPRDSDFKSLRYHLRDRSLIDPRTWLGSL